MHQKVPRGDENLICRYHKKPMSEVCHKCECWTHLVGVNPNTGERIDDWKCADSWIPIILLKIAKEIAEQGAATESLRNTTNQANVSSLNMLAGLVGAVHRMGASKTEPVLLQPADVTEKDTG